MHWDELTSYKKSYSKCNLITRQKNNLPPFVRLSLKIDENKTKKIELKDSSTYYLHLLRNALETYYILINLYQKILIIRNWFQFQFI